MSGEISLYGAVVGPLSFKAWRRLDHAYPYVVEVNGVAWALTIDELDKLGRAVTDIIRALAPRRDGGRPKEGPRFHIEPRDGDKIVTIELGIQANGDVDGFYFRFGDIAVSFPLDDGRDLLRLFDRLAEDLAGVRRATLATPAIPQGSLGDRYRPRSYLDWNPPGWL